MKRLLTIAAALLIAAMFILPASAIINLDGSEPEWGGDPRIRPLTDTIDGLELLDEELPLDGIVDIVPINEDLTDDDAVLYVGEPTDELPEDETADDTVEFDRGHLARGEGAQIEQAISSGANPALYIGLGAAGLASLALASFALVRARRKKASSIA